MNINLDQVSQGIGWLVGELRDGNLKAMDSDLISEVIRELGGWRDIVSKERFYIIGVSEF